MSHITEIFYTFRRNKSRFAWFALAMFLMSIFILSTVLTIQIATATKEKLLRNFQLEIYFQTTTTSAERDSVLNALKRRAPSGTSFQYIAPSEARERFIQEFGNDLLELLNENPLPSSFIITFPKSDATPSKMREIQRFASELPPVDEAVYEGELAGWVENQFNQAIPYVVFIGMTLAIVFIVIGGFIVRSTVVSSYEIARFFNLLGATPSYFRRPYWHLSAIIAGLTAGVAMTLGWVLVYWLSIYSTIYLGSMPYYSYLLPVFAMFVGWILGWIVTRGTGKSFKTAG